jgi:Fe-S-cluster containining protein
MQHVIDCPLLVDGACGIYDFRPAMCRKYNSLDSVKCEDPYAQIPEDLNVSFK